MDSDRRHDLAPFVGATAVVIWLERISVAASLIVIGFLLYLAENRKILWGFWSTVAGVVLALINQVGELVAARKDRL
jgi:hypothetical protein